jgi:DNA topoisomerase IB
VTGTDTLARIRELAIPPAWTDVWICPDPLGHLQATGTDAAGRKQYLYHPVWREQRDRQKFRRMTDFARGLPRLRRRVAEDLSGAKLDRTRVLAAAARMLDVGLFRIGGEEYAEQGGGLGLATLRKEHVALRDGVLVFDYPAKSGVRRLHEVHDPDVIAAVGELKRRRGGPVELLAYRDGRRWHSLRSDDINDYIKLALGDEYSAKDFRTWNATVLAAALVAAAPSGKVTKTSRKRTINAAVRDVAEVLGNTPAVARRAYIDPRVFDRYQSGWTIKLPRVGLDLLEGAAGRGRRRLELAVLDLIADPSDSAGTAKLAA